ncbi:MAG: hypothetical protein AAFY38_02085 [Pseudomonadota bacterium]
MAGREEPITITQLARQLQFKQEFAVLSAMDAYNRTLESESERMSARWLSSSKANGIKLRNMKSQQWLAGFKQFVNDGSVDKDTGLLTSAFQQLLDASPTTYTAPEPSLVGVDSLPTDLRDSVGLILDRTETNTGLSESRTALSGYYRLIRASTRASRNEYYEEPLFIGDAGDTSWLAMKTRGTPRLGFAFAGLGVVFVTFAAPHSERGLSGAMLTLHGYGYATPKFLSGVMARLSDDRSRPAAVSVLAIREDDQDVIGAWQAAQSEDNMGKLCRTITAETASEEFAMLEEFDLRHSVKGHKLDQWFELMDKHDPNPVED